VPSTNESTPENQQWQWPTTRYAKDACRQDKRRHQNRTAQMVRNEQPNRNICQYARKAERCSRCAERKVA
jgi:hypothetical protein